MNIVEKNRIDLIKKCLYYGKNEYAMLIINKIIKNEHTKDDPEILKELALIFEALKKHKAALKCIKRAFKKEKSVEHLEIMAAINERCENYEDAAIQFEELLRFKDDENTYLACAGTYRKLDLPTESIRICKECIKKHKTASSYSMLAFEYIGVGMEKEAIETCEELKKVAPNNPVTLNTLGFLEEAMYNNYPEAKKYFHKAAKMGFLEAYYNLGVCNKHTEDFAEAEKYLKRLIKLKANSKMDYNYTLGSVYLAQRKLAKGYKYYLNRKTPELDSYKNRKNYWDGKDYPDKVLYVSSEQGLGDNIQFIRYIPFVAKKFRKVIYGAYDNQVELFRESYPKEDYPNIEIVSHSEVVRYNKFVLLLDLPYLLHMNYYNIPAKEHYLVANKRKTEMFKKNFFNNDKIKIGLNWRAKGMGLRDAVYRTIDAPYYFRNIMALPNVEYYSFQMGDIFHMCEKYPGIKDITPQINDFTDTAAALKNIDILITVDTALAHIAGALGIKTYLLLCFAPDWRWFDNDKKTEWYPSVTIIKQHDRRTWNDVEKILTRKIKNDVKKMNDTL